VWLSEQGIDVSLVSVTAWQVGEQTLAGFSKVYPTPEVEEFTLAPVRAEREEVARKAAERSRTATTGRRLVDNAALADGTLLRFVAQGIDAAEKEQLESWFADKPLRATARWRNDTSQPLVWDADRTTWTPTALARHIVAEATGKATGPLRRPSWWRTEEGDDLTSLADATGGRRRDWSDLHAILAAITPGHWTSYGDLAEVIGTAAQPVGNHVTNCDQCENAYRVLSASGEVSKGFRWSNPAREGQDPARVLAEEGVAFTGNSASPRQRLTPKQLRALVTH